MKKVLVNTFKKLPERVIPWGIANMREFPWRKNSDPYRILIAEIMLHRTRAENVVPVYNRFTIEFPTSQSFSMAKHEKIVEILKPLGLVWRSDKLYEMSMILRKDFQGHVPLEKHSLKTLPGVGEYIASAVMCFSTNSPEVLLEVNTVRIASRVMGVKLTDNLRRSKLISDFYQREFDEDEPRKFYYSLIDLGSLVCRSENPKCNECPLNDICLMALNEGNNERSFCW